MMISPVGRSIFHNVARSCVSNSFLRNYSGGAKTILVAGGRNGIGAGLVKEIERRSEEKATKTNVIVTSSQFSSHEVVRQTKFVSIHHIPLIIDDKSVKNVGEWIEGEYGKLDIVINTIGALHGSIGDKQFLPEKSFGEIDPEWVMESYKINTLPTVLMAKYFCPLLSIGKETDHPAIFSSISARIGSISDNKAGGWFSYRMSKAALNQFIKTLSIELSRSAKSTYRKGRRNIYSMCLHPGTVETNLSEPFKKNIKYTFSVEECSSRLLDIVENGTEKENGSFLAYDKSTIPW